MAQRASSHKNGKRSLVTSSDSEDEDRSARASPPSSFDENVPKPVPLNKDIHVGDVPVVFFFNYRVAFNYINKVKATCSPLAIRAFRELINDLSVKCVDEADVIQRLENIFGTYEHLASGFKVFRSPRGRFTDVASTVHGVIRLQTVVEETLGPELPENPMVHGVRHATSPPRISPTQDVINHTTELLERGKKLHYHCALYENRDYAMDNMGESEEYKALCAANLAKDRARLRKAGLLID